MTHRNLTAFFIAVVVAAAAMTACSYSPAPTGGALERAEQAFAEGRAVSAQAIADSIVLGSSFGDLDTEGLCRLSILFVHLGENAPHEETNMAFAAHALKAAYMRDSAYTAQFVSALPVEDRPGIMIVTAIVDAANPLRPDTLDIPADTIP